jgi:hypothetical protein
MRAAGSGACGKSRPAVSAVGRGAGRMSPVRKHVKIAGRTFCARTPGTTTDGEKAASRGLQNHANLPVIMVTYFVIAVGLPLALVCGNSAVRWAFRLPQSAPADLILVLIAFDIAVLINPAELTILVPNARELYGLVTVVTFVLWAITLGRLERDLHSWMASRPRRGYPYRLMFCSLGASGLALVANLSPIAAGSLK